jgi:hypothetical protein
MRFRSKYFSIRDFPLNSTQSSDLHDAALLFILRFPSAGWPEIDKWREIPAQLSRFSSIFTRNPFEISVCTTPTSHPPRAQSYDDSIEMI